MTQMGCRSSGTQEEAVHCCSHSSALGAFEPAAGARRRSCGQSSSSESFTWSVSVGGENGYIERAGLARGTGAPNATLALARTHLLIVILVVLIETLIVIIFILKVLVIERFAGREDGITWGVRVLADC